MAMWYYAVDEAHQGPVDAEDISRLLATGTIGPDTLVWRDGLAGWEAASDHFPAPAPASPTPPPPPSQPAVDTRILPAASPFATASGAVAGQPGSEGAGPASRTAAPTAPGAPPRSDAELGPDGLYIHAPSRGFGEAISVCLRKYVGFSGRASRSEYWFYILFLFIAGLITSVIDAVIFQGVSQVSPLNSLFSLATFLPSMAVSWRRLHDTDRSGWWVGGFYLGGLAFAILAGVRVTSSVDLQTGEPPVGLLGLFALGGLAFLAYVVVLLVFFCQKGTLGPNRFG